MVDVIWLLINGILATCIVVFMEWKTKQLPSNLKYKRTLVGNEIDHSDYIHIIIRYTSKLMVFAWDARRQLVKWWAMESNDRIGWPTSGSLSVWYSFFNVYNVIFTLRNMTHATLWPPSNQHGGCHVFNFLISNLVVFPYRMLAHQTRHDVTCRKVVFWYAMFWYTKPRCSVSPRTMSVPWIPSQSVWHRCAWLPSVSLQSQGWQPKIAPDLTES